MDEEKIIHRRLISGSTLLIEELIKLGYEEFESIGHGFNRSRVFKKGKKIVHTSHNEMVLFEEAKIEVSRKSKAKLQEMKDQRIIHFQGSSIHDEILKFFTNRTPQEIKNE